MGPFQNTNDAFHTHECLDSTCLVPLCLSTRTKVVEDFLLLLQPFSAKLVTWTALGVGRDWVRRACLSFEDMRYLMIVSKATVRGTQTTGCTALVVE
ncbi:hypothetical protein EJ06DRAFT_533737 [Trichodelitschia bisporula]|uniref:Uncharacterized protein n=1 Tax=Trichodelitschia bisporula TaxID=703511 RepID=A0A6G1HMP1_9PEZI|nr:hypothetical protein EJ06DRAFT_533737 [Trichodelitschia bisporula]